ncbi:MAG: AI-2E family transporter, partial [Pseudomonadota bacterium]
AISGFVVGVGLALAQSPGWELPALVAGVFLAGQLLEGNFLTPKLVGDKVGLHPVWIMFALLAGAALFGFVGILLAVPVAAVIGVLVRFALGRYLESPLYHGNHL